MSAMLCGIQQPLDLGFIQVVFCAFVRVDRYTLYNLPFGAIRLPQILSASIIPQYHTLYEMCLL